MTDEAEDLGYRSWDPDFESDWEDLHDDEDSLEVTDDPVLTACPACRAEIYDESQQCPECGEFVTVRCRQGSSGWIWFGAVLILTAMAAFILRFVH